MTAPEDPEQQECIHINPTAGASAHLILCAMLNLQFLDNIFLEVHLINTAHTRRKGERYSRQDHKFTHLLLLNV